MKKENSILNKLLLSLIFLSSLLLMGQSCREKEEYDYVQIDFVLPLSITPVQETFKRGDTLWLSANIPDTIFEFNSNRYYKVENFNFPTRIGFFELISNQKYMSEQPGAAAHFKIVNKVGSADNFSDTFGDFKMLYADNFYKCLIGIVPQKAGIFCINFLSPDGVNLSFLDLGVNSNGIKRRAMYRFFLYVINNGENNLSLLKQNMKLGSTSLGNFYYEQKGTFTFQVVE